MAFDLGLQCFPRRVCHYTEDKFMHCFPRSVCYYTEDKFLYDLK